MKKLSRREFIKITAIAGGGLFASSLIPKGIFKEAYTLTDTRTLMGTIIHLKMICSDKAEGKNALNQTFAEMERLVQMFNLRDQTSQICNLNQEGILHDASPEMLNVLSQAINYGELSNGAFDITIQPVLAQIREGNTLNTNISDLVNHKNIKITNSSVSFLKPDMKITLDGIAKGFVVDRGVETLKNLGYGQALVEAGGDLAVSGNNLNKDGWSIGLSSPRPENLDGYIAVFSINKGAVATSGDYINWFTEDKSSHHIIDPASNQSPSELASATVYAPSALESDAMSTAIMVLGLDEGLKLANKLDNVEAFVVTKDMKIHRTNGFPTNS
ncbi:MAG: FAD:protein FMN transferase [Bacteroidetes bacterium]|jgi:FAD:protein FMN transferase|nr:FAD:protein FMN transferase [Chloroflexota bacterium]MBT3935391.1 FAD:protein FMN transferase [Bacteroidota bacterium]MBT4306195.1 FAD:protein FMN transferase [Chloroflexota bacterium]MBT6834595.1 FAD:protein FMN transferase [Bacteroidota bacterium]MBT6988456.1 FAD:protein FMN transferase [Chloroflexota bacterium]